ncbi:MAG TPA: hypothetical protein VIW29_13540 [Polyangiaceae bacterium]
MRSVVMCGTGVVFIALIATACGSADKARAAFDGDAGEGGQGEAGASDAPGGSPASGEGGTAGSSDPAAGGAAGSSAPGSGGATGNGGSADSGGASGNFVPPPPRLALGGPHSCALKLDETVACWGRGDHGELGDGEFHVVPGSFTPLGLADPVSVQELGGVTAITSGLFHSCALRGETASIYCWGAGNAGQLGDGIFHMFDDAGVALPQLVEIDDVAQVSAAGSHTCVLLGDGSVWCWGDNLFGQLGDDSMTNSATPLRVDGLSGVVQLAVGKDQTCALMEDSTVQCWGSGGVNNQAGTTISLLDPTPIDGVTGATALAAGDGFTCALVAGGEVQCWGEGDVGQLGDGLMNDSNTTPVRVTGLSGVVQLSAGARHVCALDADQAVWCWGKGDFGQLGDGIYHNGFPTFVTEPVAAELLTDVVEVACGEDHTCVRTSADEILCIGLGGYGQLGDGSFYSASPFGSATPVTALSL